MSRKIIILLILLVAAVLYYIPELYMTAFLAYVGQIEMNATVNPGQYDYTVIIQCLNDTIEVDQPVFADISIKNYGVYEGDVNVDWWVEDVYGNTYDSNSTVTNISYGETWSSIKSLFIPPSASSGTYYFKINVSVDYYHSTSYDILEVQVPITTTIPSVTGVGVTSYYGGIKSEKKPSIEIKYLSNHIVIPGVPKEYDIEIKNSGNLILHNLTLYLQGIDSTWYSISPERTDLEPNKTIVFKINYNLPSSVEIKKYPMSIMIKSDETQKTIPVTLSIIKILEKSEFERTIENLQKEIDELENELMKLEQSGINADSLQKLLFTARERLELAKKEMEIGDLVKANELLQEAKNLIDIIKETKSSLKPFETRNIIIIVSASIVVVSLVFFFKIYKKPIIKGKRIRRHSK
jgi:hypothetical protein